MFEKTYLQGSLEGVLEVIQVSRLSWYPYNLKMVVSFLQSSSPREKEKKRDNSHNGFMGTFSYSHSPHIYEYVDFLLNPS